MVFGSAEWLRAEEAREIEIGRELRDLEASRAPLVSIAMIEDLSARVGVALALRRPCLAEPSPTP